MSSSDSRVVVAPSPCGDSLEDSSSPTSRSVQLTGMEHLSSEEGLRELGSSSLEKRKLWGGHLTAAFQ